MKMVKVTVHLPDFRKGPAEVGIYSTPISVKEEILKGMEIPEPDLYEICICPNQDKKIDGFSEGDIIYIISKPYKLLLNLINSK